MAECIQTLHTSTGRLCATSQLSASIFQMQNDFSLGLNNMINLKQNKNETLFIKFGPLSVQSVKHFKLFIRFRVVKIIGL